MYLKPYTSSLLSTSSITTEASKRVLYIRKLMNIFIHKGFKIFNSFNESIHPCDHCLALTLAGWTAAAREQYRILSHIPRTHGEDRATRLRRQPVDLIVNPRRHVADPTTATAKGFARNLEVAVDPWRHVSDPVCFSLYVVDAGGPVRGDGVAPHAAGCVRRADAALEYASEAALAYIRRGLRDMWRPEHSGSF